MASEARYTVYVDRRGNHPVVYVSHQGRPVAERTIATLSDAMWLGGLLVDPATPSLPVCERTTP